MTFKQDWEKKDQIITLPLEAIQGMLAAAFPNKNLISHEIISGGCANLNIKIQLERDEHPFILRVYLRDETSAYREQKLGALLKQTVPVPTTYYIGKYDGYYFAITEFMEGITLRDLLLGNLSHDIGPIMHEVGVLLSRIADHEFPKAGFFDKDLNVIEHTPQDDYLTFSKKCLQNKIVVSQLNLDVISKINYFLDKYGYFYPDENEKHLVHADFDPANILVNKIDGTWRVTGILDWEFSFSGSKLCDVANILRYAHHMPSQFEEAFLRGLSSGGISLAANWRITVHMLNLLSLLDCLVRSDPEDRPNQCADIRELIIHIIRRFNEAG